MVVRSTLRKQLEEAKAATQRYSDVLKNTTAAGVTENVPMVNHDFTKWNIFELDADSRTGEAGGDLGVVGSQSDASNSDTRGGVGRADVKAATPEPLCPSASSSTLPTHTPSTGVMSSLTASITRGLVEQQKIIQNHTERPKMKIIIPVDSLPLTRQEIKRQEIIFELVATEKDYLRDLALVCKVDNF